MLKTQCCLCETIIRLHINDTSIKQFFYLYPDLQIYISTRISNGNLKHVLNFRFLPFPQFTVSGVFSSSVKSNSNLPVGQTKICGVILDSSLSYSHVWSVTNAVIST